MRKKDPRTAQLRGLDLFAGCNDKELARISGVLTESKIAAGEVLTREGRHESEQCFLILEGEVAVSLGGVELATLGTGSIVGEMNILNRSPRSATVTALTPLRVLIFDPRSFTTVIDTMPAVRRAVMRLLASRLREADLAAAR